MTYVVFADDHVDMRHMVRDLLQASGHEVGLCPDGETALAVVSERPPDLLILDLNMPGISGFDVCRSVKRNPSTSHVPVLMLTSRGDIEHKVEGFDAGADDYLPKPFDPRELRARVDAMLRLVRREGDRNPTTGLPGGRAIEEEIRRRVEAGLRFAVCYLDLDHFKAFADSFGFAEADRVIREAGRAFRDAVDSSGALGDFCGHIGGDDFIIVTTPGLAESIARESAQRFRAVVANVVGEESVACGTFEGVDRSGERRSFPIACVSTVIITVEPGQPLSATEIGARAAELKREAKHQGAGTILKGSV